ncbi:MAG TPA: MFS transporter, partial [Mycobacteriales bacterium]|nr:MFS transporter [Mycobacteriales bacterium]
GLADRFPRRNVMVVCDAARAVLVMGLAIPSMPLAGLYVLLIAVASLQPPFNTARASLLPDLVGEGEPYALASTLSNTTIQLGSVLGWGVGGAAVAILGARTSIIVDAATFGLSAWLVVHWVRPRGAADAGPRDIRAEMRQGISVVFGDPELRWLVLTASVVIAAAISTAGVAVPYAMAHHAGPTTAGVLVALMELGVVIGTTVLGRVLRPAVAERMILPGALASTAILATTGFDLPIAATATIWLLGSAFSAVQVVAGRVFIEKVPRELRGRAFGVAAACIAVGQGVGLTLAGAIADLRGPAIGVADVALPALALVVILAVRRHSSSSDKTAPIYDERPDQDEGTMQPPRSRLRSQSRVWGLNAAMSLTAALLLWRMYSYRAVTPIGLPSWWVLLLFVIAYAAPLRFVFRRQAWALNLTDVPFVLGLFFLAPSSLVLIRTIASLGTSLAKRQRAIQLIFNVLVNALCAIFGILIFRALVPSGGGVHDSSWLGAFVAVFADTVTSTALLITVFLLSRTGWDRSQTLQMATMFGASGVVNTFLALVTASALDYDTSTAFAITVFVVLSMTAVRMYHRLADRHAALDKLYAVARELGPVTTDPGDLAPALTQLRRIMRAETLELAMLADDPGFANVITVFERDEGEGVTVSDRPVEADLRRIYEDSRLPVLRPLQRLIRTWRRDSDDKRILVPVGPADHPRAILTARDRTGDGSGFDGSDLRLLEAAAEQLSTALEKGRLIEGLRRAATRDSLTDLANLDSLRSFLTTMLAEGMGGVVLLLDIDRFQEINDTLGHDAGDAILVEVARRLEAAPSQGALVSRVGGDQFAMAIPGSAGGEVARLAALAVKSRIDGPLRFPSFSADLRVTVGIARAPDHGNDAPTILRRAEMAMTAAKGSSTGIGEWEPGYEEDGTRRLQVLAGVREALASNALTVQFQPKLKLNTGEVTGFEALVRWTHPELGPISPAEFVPMAEASGLISALTSGVLRMALDACRRWHDAGRPVGVAVNISARSLDDPVLVGQVAAMLTASGVEPRWLTLEITESSVMENAARSLEVLRQLRSLGCRLSIDDFGTGYSSLHQLRGLPVHEVKIDKAFVDHVDGDGADRAVVRAIVELCDSLGLATVAEGVEQASQAYVLDSLGVRQVQGYFYGRPMPEEAATEWLMPRDVAAHDEASPDMPRG